MTSLDKLFKGTFFEELKTIEDLDPNSPPGENEQIIGEMNEAERKIFALSVKYARMSQLIELKAKFDAHGDEKAKLISAWNDTEKIHDSFMGIMWALINQRIPTPHDMVVGIREGFTIVMFKDRGRSGMPKGLEKLLKGIGAKFGGVITLPSDDDDDD